MADSVWTNIIKFPAEIFFHNVVRGFQFFTKIHEPEGKSLQTWNTIFLLSCLISLLLDPLFFYIPLIHEEKTCYMLDRKLAMIATFIRSIMDIFYLVHIILQFRISFKRPLESRKGSKKQSLGEPSGYELVKDSWEIAKRYMRTYFLVDILAILPFPQVIILLFIPNLRGVKFPYAADILPFVILLPYIPRGLRIYWYKKVTSTSGSLTETAWPEALFNLSLYLVASHVLGAIWYFFSIAREISCWRKACAHIRCLIGSFYCTPKSGNVAYLGSYCSVETPKSTGFKFGIFSDALESGIVKRKNFLNKLLHCFRWGVQNLSGFGQNLEPSDYFWENFFVVIIIIIGLVLFLLLIGNMQIYLQFSTMKKEEMRARKRDLEMWMTRYLLPKDIRTKIRQYEQYKWQENRGIDVENLLNNIPKSLSGELKHYLCSDLLKYVPVLKEMDEKLMKNICESLKPIFYTEGSLILREGDDINEIILIESGTVLSVTRNAKYFFAVKLHCFDFCGEELLHWALDDHASKVPTSTSSVRALTNVEAFVLTAETLKHAVMEYRKLCNDELPGSFRYYLWYERASAASRIQIHWRRYLRQKEITKLMDEKRKVDEHCRGRGI